MSDEIIYLIGFILVELWELSAQLYKEDKSH